MHHVTLRASTCVLMRPIVIQRRISFVVKVLVGLLISLLAWMPQMQRLLRQRPRNVHQQTILILTRYTPASVVTRARLLSRPQQTTMMANTVLRNTLKEIPMVCLIWRSMGRVSTEQIAHTPHFLRTSVT